MNYHNWIEPYATIISSTPTAVNLICYAGRTCYDAADKPRKDISTDDFVRVYTTEENENFIRARILAGHESILEHASATVRIVANRAIANEIVRHRVAAYSQQSTRYCNYAKPKYEGSIPVIWPENLDKHKMYARQFDTEVESACKTYFALIRSGVAPETARDVLPHCTATVLIMTANMREWRHVFQLRADKAAHPAMRRLMRGLFEQFKANWPCMFDDIKPEENVNSTENSKEGNK